MSEMNQLTNVKGWGADLDPANRPAVPKERTPPHGTGAHWDHPERQVAKVKIYHSVERPGLTSVFGTSAPPRGLSGAVRQLAFKFSEAQLAHWMTLLLADRINVFEGIIEDFSHGHVPNLIKEMGWRAELKHHPRSLPRRGAMVASLCAAAGFGLFMIARQRKSRISKL